MNKVAVVYWSGTGNTEAMAECVVIGAKEAGADVVVYTASEFCKEMVSEYDAIAFGCPSMGSEELEEGEFEPMFSSLGDALKNKKIALFGSYGWGDGEWMRNWEDRCNGLSSNLVCESVICNGQPDDIAKDSCKLLGKYLTN